MNKAENDLKVEVKTTPGEGDEGFEGPPCRQSLEEDVEPLDKDVEKEENVETLGNKAENRAVQGTNAWVPESVKSDDEKARMVKKTPEFGGLRQIVAPEEKEASIETSETENKAKILSAKARGGSEAEMSGSVSYTHLPSPRDS